MKEKRARGASTLRRSQLLLLFVSPFLQPTNQPRTLLISHSHLVLSAPLDPHTSASAMLAGRLARASACSRGGGGGGGRALPRARPTVLARGGPEIADPQRASQLEQLRDLFKAYDTDGSGCVFDRQKTEVVGRERRGESPSSSFSLLRAPPLHIQRSDGSSHRPGARRARPFDRPTAFTSPDLAPRRDATRPRNDERSHARHVGVLRAKLPSDAAAAHLSSNHL